jgi:glycosyltransferase involved in cell wall biosynthesis
MFVKNIIENRYIQKYIKVNVKTLVEELLEIRKESDFIIITGKPVGNSWRGMYNGAKAFLPNATFAMPQYFSKNIYSQNELNIISDNIISLGFKKVMIKGYADFLKKILFTLHPKIIATNNKTEIYLTYHGSLSSNSEVFMASGILKEILELHKSGFVKKIGFVKKGLAETIEKVTGIKTYFIINKTNVIESKRIISTDCTSGLNIGVYTHDQYRKNIHNQVAAALMFENAKVHIHKNYGFDYLFSDHRLFIHPFFESYNDFLQLMGSMTLNFYVSFSECFGMVITESLAMGVPCLAADNSGLFDYDEELKNLLIVKEFDDSNAIYKQAMIVIENRQLISNRGIDYVKVLNKIAEEKFRDFINT